MSYRQQGINNMKLEVNLDLCFWAMPFAVRWQFTDIPNYHYIAIHLLCLEIYVEWI